MLVRALNKAFALGFLLLLPAPFGLVLMISSPLRAADSDRESKLKLFAAARGAERILIAVPQHKSAGDGLVDIPPGKQFVVEIERALRGPGNKATSVMVINGGDEKTHPKYYNGKPYIFLLKKNPEGKGWINLGQSEIPIKDGKVQHLVDGKVAAEVKLDEFEDFAAKDAQPVAEKMATRDSLTGKWIVATSNKGLNLYLWLVDLSAKDRDKNADSAEDGKETSVKLLSSSKVMQAATLKSAEIVGNDVHLVFEGDGSSLDFRGRFEDGVVRGNVALGRALVTPAWMEPTELTNMRKYEGPVRDPAQDEFAFASTQENAAGALARFLRRYPNSALALSAYQDLIMLAADEKMSREKFEKLAAEYLAAAHRWGLRIELQAQIDLGTLLSRKDHLPELALEYLNSAAERFDEDTPPDARKVIGIERGKRLLAAGQTKDGVAALVKVREDFPFDAEATYALARQAEKDNRVEEALALFGELLVMPQLEQALTDSQKAAGRKLPPDQTPRRSASRLWAREHGDPQGLPTWLNELYQARIKSIATEKLPPRANGDGTRVVLCELFTGATGATSVAADAALAALEGATPPTEVIALRYHVNAPAPDPLANEETQERYKMSLGTMPPPVLLVDGRILPVIAGGITEAPAVYRRLRTVVETALKDQIDLSLAMSATAEKGQIAISVKALGLTSFPPNTRMQIVLAEDLVEFAAGNGIRFHQMVVRSLPAGVTGAAPVTGVLHYKGDVDINKLKRHLTSQLKKAELEAEAPFEAKPLELKALHLVAYLQNIENGEVLQAASIPVAGLTPPADSKKSGEN